MTPTPLDAWMIANNVTDAALAERVDVSRPFISRIRQGLRQPSLKVALRLAKETELPASTFLMSDAA